MGFNCLDCKRHFCQIVVVITAIIVALLGLCSLIIGIWANLHGDSYVDITDSNSQFTYFSILAIVLGVLVFITGVVGVVGAIFGSTTFGKVLLGLYAIVLTLLVICEISGGIAAAVKKGDLESVFYDSANTTLLQYLTDKSKQEAWDTFQKTFYCCGINGTHDYLEVYRNETVPFSCCIHADDDNALDECELDNFYSDTLYQRGCTYKLIEGFGNILDWIAIGLIVFGSIQILGIIIAACRLCLGWRNEDRKEVKEPHAPICKPFESPSHTPPGSVLPHVHLLLACSSKVCCVVSIHCPCCATTEEMASPYLYEKINGEMV